jgi:hypothetical protein
VTAQIIHKQLRWSLANLTRWLILLLLCGIPIQALTANEHQTSIDDDRLVAAYLFNFARFARWPDSAFSTDSTLVIGVMGNAAFFDEFATTVSKRQIGEHKVKAVTIEDLQHIPEILHLLYIKDPSPEQLTQILTQTEITPSLIVVDSQSCPNISHHICLALDDGKVSFSVDLSAIRHRSLEVDGRILRLAAKVKR